MQNVKTGVAISIIVLVAAVVGVSLWMSGQANVRQSAVPISPVTPIAPSLNTKAQVVPVTQSAKEPVQLVANVGSYPDPMWQYYEDKDVKFSYPKTFCGTNWQESWDIHSCEESWVVERTSTAYSSSDYAGGEKNARGQFIQIMPSYSSYGFEFGGDFQITFFSKEDFDREVNEKTLQQETTKQGYVAYPENGVQKSDLNTAVAFYITDGAKHVKLESAFSDRYPRYLLYLKDSILLR